LSAFRNKIKLQVNKVNAK